ncbi:hypothetical protein CBX96_04950 [Shewanella sp. BC20]|uniref:hypothetical protein n=1 Tax=Shewanella sp. BC20 TaxID=2004459 RepID=UPI000D65229B|nr:hypothetical protein [Shewanella sp. BC20]PWF64497.1 hypothetical protein CBX96_04950 [Shewanella sp. BC20]
MSFAILAEVEVLKVEDKDCLARFASGARPTISYKGLEVSGSSFASCAINLGDVEEAFPGDKLEIEIGFLNPELHESLMYVGLEFGLYAGPWMIAKGTVSLLSNGI